MAKPVEKGWTPADITGLIVALGPLIKALLKMLTTMNIAPAQRAALKKSLSGK